jgi:hypothetical protein
MRIACWLNVGGGDPTRFPAARPVVVAQVQAGVLRRCQLALDRAAQGGCRVLIACRRTVTCRRSGSAACCFPTRTDEKTAAAARVDCANRFAFGIHAYGGATTNSGTRINADVFARLTSWKA